MERVVEEESYKEDPCRFEDLPETEKNKIDSDIRHLYEDHENWKCIRTFSFVHNTARRYNLRLNQYNIDTCIKFVQHVFRLQDKTFQVRVAFGYILEIPPDENYGLFRIYYASDNYNILGVADMDKVVEVLRSREPYEYETSNTKLCVRRITNMMLFIDKMSNVSVFV